MKHKQDTAYHTRIENWNSQVTHNTIIILCYAICHIGGIYTVRTRSLAPFSEKYLQRMVRDFWDILYNATRWGRNSVEAAIS